MNKVVKIMNEQQLSKRLSIVASFIPKGAILADIGSDHAYLPTFSYLQGMIVKGIAGEVNQGPYELAKKRVASLKLTEVIDVRKGDGLEVITKGEVTCITISGMGGGLIQSILEQGKDKLTGKERFILQPNNRADKVRRWLLENDYELKAEEIIEEDEKIYEILVAEKGDSQKPYRTIGEVGLLVGPYLAKQKNKVFIKKWTNEIKKLEKILQQVNEATDKEQMNVKQKEIEQKIAKIRSVL